MTSETENVQSIFQGKRSLANPDEELIGKNPPCRSSSLHGGLIGLAQALKTCMPIIGQMKATKIHRTTINRTLAMTPNLRNSPVVNCLEL